MNIGRTINPNMYCDCCKKLIVGTVKYAVYPTPLCGVCFNGYRVYEERTRTLMLVEERIAA